MRPLRLLMLVAAMLLASPAARAEPPAGIVMALTGDTDPALSAMAEIPANTPVKLGAATELMFLHYSRCRLITVVGGTVTLTRADYKADGRMVADKDGPCPRVHALSDVGTEGRNTGGLIARSMEPPPRWPEPLDVIFTGSRGSQVRLAVVVADDQPDQVVLRLDLGRNRAQMPPDAPPLTADKRYRLRLGFADRRDPVDVPFLAAGSSAAGSLVILRVD